MLVSACDLSSAIGGLNPEQRDAVLVDGGPCLVVAGAGSGKTRVLTLRISRLLAQGLAKPWEVLAVTFTNKAAKEIRERVAHAVGEDRAAGLWMGSFHGVSLRILRRHAQACGLRNDSFKILDEDAQQILTKEAGIAVGLIEDLDAKDLKRRVREIHAAIQAWKEEGWTPEDAGAQTDLMRLPGAREMLAAYRHYQASLLARNACDFADLLLHPLALWRRDASVRQEWEGKFRQILVDEFQDTNRLQYDWLRILAAGHGNLFCVGDPDQSIYEWRGARPAIMLGFPKDFPGARLVTVDRNYRSTREILDPANRIVEANQRLGEKRLRSDASGAAVETALFEDERAEADAVVQEAMTLLRQGTPAREIAILLRSAGPMRTIEQALRLQSVPYEVVGGQRFDERREVRDAMAYLRLAADPSDDLAFLRIANVPVRGLGETSAQAVVARRLRDGGSLAEALRSLAADRSVRLQARAREAMPELARILEEAAEAAASGLRSPGAVLESMLDEVGYVPWLRDSGDDLAEQRAEVLAEMVAEGASGRFGSVGQWLQEIALLSAADEARDLERIRLSTVHAAKGLEYDVVFSPCLEDGILPNARAVQEAYGMAEERRIAHVAWTRARKRLYVSCAGRRHGQGASPSPFFEEAGLGAPPPRHRFGGPVMPPSAPRGMLQQRFAPWRRR
jgi:DNA helicase-2/ATP-dependent DNA helicase PcrA